MPAQVNYDQFLHIGMYVGTIKKASLNIAAIKPAYVLEIDFGDLGVKTSSAQITENYKEEELVGKQVIAVLNLPEKRVAGIKSECLVLAAVCDTAKVVILSLDRRVENGTRIL